MIDEQRHVINLTADDWDILIRVQRKMGNPMVLCAHEACQLCSGTGIRRDGMGACIHALYCACTKCSPR